MRIALLVLLAANLVFVVVQIYVPRDDRAPVTAAVPGVESLTLVSERPPVQEPPPARGGQAPESMRQAESATEPDPGPSEPDAAASAPETGEQSAASVATVRECFTLGPYRERELADAAAARIRAAGLPASRRSSVEPELRSYWVLIPPLPTKAAADAIATQLERRDVKDFFVTEEPLNGISLGLFSQRGYAERRLRQMEELGYEVEIQPIYRDRTVYWLDYETRGERQVPEQVWRGSVPDGGGIERLPRECP